MKTAPQTAHTQHTPGPWQAVGNRVYHDFKIGDENASRFIASANCCDDYTPVSQQEANARLIAAAPELLAALEEMTALAWEILQSNPKLFPKADRIFPRARVAIAKAKATQ